MDTGFIKIDPGLDYEKICEQIEPAARIIAEGGLVAFPTETVYGLGANALNEDAAKKIYAAKGRPSDNPLIIHIADIDSLYEIGKDVPDAAIKLAKAFWPGPLTMIVNKKDNIPYTTTGGLDTVAVRFPSHPVARALIQKSGCFIAAPSANTSGRPSPTLAKHVTEDMNGKIEMIVDGGECNIGLESTIVDLTDSKPVILRPGYITLPMIKNLLSECEVDPGIIAADSLKKPKAPGMKYKHYAPKAELTVVDGSEDAVVETINRLSDELRKNGKKVGIIATESTIGRYRGDILENIGSRDDEETIARNLFAVLRDFDEKNVDRIFSESFESPNVGQAIMNRLLKAAGHKVIKAD
ncbi:MAG: threonylcarbamoyl-AMP synthase [Lachnospiraceae bacterium]|nr:threonylcarbamoyl-AMP synthase [Lachnospiraceae bacterium]